MFNYFRFAWIPDSIKTEIAHLVRSFVGAVLAGAAMAAFSWLGAHLPGWVHTVGLMSGGYIGVRSGIKNVD